MKTDNYSTKRKELVKEKVVVQYNEEGDLISRPSSLAENDNDEYYLNCNNLNYLTRYRSRKSRSRSYLSLPNTGDKNIPMDKTKRLKNQGRYNSLFYVI